MSECGLWIFVYYPYYVNMDCIKLTKGKWLVFQLIYSSERPIYNIMLWDKNTHVSLSILDDIV